MVLLFKSRVKAHVSRSKTGKVEMVKEHNRFEVRSLTGYKFHHSDGPNTHTRGEGFGIYDNQAKGFLASKGKFHPWDHDKKTTAHEIAKDLNTRGPAGKLYYGKVKEAPQADKKPGKRAISNAAGKANAGHAESIPDKPTKGSITVAAITGPLKIDAEIWGPVAIHKDIGGGDKFTVTHLRTGLTLAGSIKKGDAVAKIKQAKEEGLHFNFTTTAEAMKDKANIGRLAGIFRKSLETEFDLLKSHVQGYTRHTKTGKTVMVREHEDARAIKEENRPQKGGGYHLGKMTMPEIMEATKKGLETLGLRQEAKELNEKNVRQHVARIINEFKGRGLKPLWKDKADKVVAMYESVQRQLQALQPDVKKSDPFEALLDACGRGFRSLAATVLKKSASGKSLLTFVR